MIYKCSICGYIFDEEKEGRKFAELKECPLCRQPADKFVPGEDKELSPGPGTGAVEGILGDSTKTETEKIQLE